MASTVKITVEARGVLNSLQRLRTDIGNLQPVLRNAAAELTRRVQARFTSKRDPDGQRWAPWAPSTAARYKRDGRHQLMLYTRQTRDQVKFIAGRNDIRLRLGTSYAAYHEQPDGPGSGRIPRRAFVFSKRGSGRGLSKSDEQYVYNALRYQISKSVSAASGGAA
ncbi:hypothetical protein RugamoR57_37540 [Duganella caerulea]|uniref:phage virion morphogenesis protein n=1 Tax=Duganella caerulea TaxID=2885762 RepID=UPI0030EA934C